jgi:hypothetical protein
MKTLLAATLIGLAVVTFATPAAAYVVAVTTSFAVDTIDDEGDLAAALESAVDDVLSHAIAFSPTFVTVQTARVVGDRVYILLLIGDGEGEETMETMKKLSVGAETKTELSVDAETKTY